MSILEAPTGQSSAEAITRRVGELTERFRARMPITEQQQSIPRDSIDELVDAGLARMLVPAEHGGLDLRIRDAVDVAVLIGRGCASTGWVSWLMMHDPHVIAMFPLEAQRAVWSSGPNVVTAGSHMGMNVEVAPGGYRISGRGPFTSGVNNAEWVYVGGMQRSAAGPPKLRYFLLPRSAFTIEDTWDTVGMRGTGSNTVVVEDVFVPEYMTLDHVDAREGTGPGTFRTPNPTAGVPWVATGALGFIGTMLGAALGAFDDVAGALSKKKPPGGARVADSEVLQMEVGLVSVRLDAAQMLLASLADRADSGVPFSLTERAALTRTGAYIVTLILESIDKLIELAGTSGFGSAAVVQQSCSSRGGTSISPRRTSASTAAKCGVATAGPFSASRRSRRPCSSDRRPPPRLSWRRPSVQTPGPEPVNREAAQAATSSRASRGQPSHNRADGRDRRLRPSSRRAARAEHRSCRRRRRWERPATRRPRCAGFMPINDHYGHRAGDDVRARVWRRHCPVP